MGKGVRGNVGFGLRVLVYIVCVLSVLYKLIL